MEFRRVSARDKGLWETAYTDNIAYTDNTAYAANTAYTDNTAYTLLANRLKSNALESS